MKKIAFYFLFALVFSIPWQAIIVIPGMGTFTRLLGIIVFLIAIFYIIANKRINEVPLLLWIMIAFIGWSFISIIWSINPSATLSRMFTYFQLIAMTWLIWELCKDEWEFKLILQAYVLGAFIPVIDIIYLFFSISAPVQRIATEGFDPNWLATTLALGIPISWYLVSKWKSKIMITLNMVYVPLTIFAVILTGSRGGFIVTVVSLLIIPFSYLLVSKNIRYITSAFIGVCVVIGILYSPKVAENLQYNIDRISGISTEVREGAMAGRRNIWKVGFEVFKENPIIGVGSASFRFSIENVIGRPRASHNTILSVLVDTGIIGLILFMSMFIIAIIPYFKGNQLELIFYFVLLLTLFVGMIPINWEANKALWYVLTICSLHSVLLIRDGKLVVISR